ncbi:MAG: 50S ribosomal protein L24 [candidate division WWE3 bacterium]|nr:50S ribosomal protein L24 [candidate division WWE3 bacterium]
MKQLKVQNSKLKIKKGDQVKILSGKDKGREGEVLRVLPVDRKVIVSGINLLKRFTKKTKDSAGGIVEAEAPLWASKVGVVCPKCKKFSRLTKNRICRHCGESVDKKG